VRGLVRPEDMPKKTGNSKTTAADRTDPGDGEDAAAPATPSFKMG
jgi:hypothetical protein